MRMCWDICFMIICYFVSKGEFRATCRYSTRLESGTFVALWTIRNDATRRSLNIRFSRIGLRCVGLFWTSATGSSWRSVVDRRGYVLLASNSRNVHWLLIGWKFFNLGYSCRLTFESDPTRLRPDWNIQTKTDWPTTSLEQPDWQSEHVASGRVSSGRCKVVLTYLQGSHAIVKLTCWNSHVQPFERSNTLLKLQFFGMRMLICLVA